MFNTGPLLFFCLLLGYVCVCFFAWLFQPFLLYRPTKKFIGTPKDYDADFEEVLFQTKEAKTLHGWYIPVKGSRYTLLYCHGNRGNISDFLRSLKIYYELGLSVFIFDYQGYGKSDGRPTEQGTYEDVSAAWECLIKNYALNPSDIILCGRSLGGPIAAWAAKKFKPKALLLELTFTSFEEIAKKNFFWLPVKKLLRFKYPTIEYLKKVTCPVLVAHSPEDQVIPFEMGLSLFTAASEPKAFVEIFSIHHDGVADSKDVYMPALKDFIGNL